MEGFLIDFVSKFGLEGVLMSIFTFVVVAVLKFPYKLLTKTIKNERLRKLANIVIIFMAFGVGLGAKLLYDSIIGVTTDNIIIWGLANGAGATFTYAFIEQLTGGKVKSPISNSATKVIIDATQEVLKDGKVDNQDNDEVKTAVEDLYKIL